MSLTHNELRMMMKAARSATAPYQRFYGICEAFAYMAFLIGWAFAILAHL